MRLNRVFFPVMALVIGVVLLSCAYAEHDTSKSTGRLLIANVTLLSPERDTPLTEAFVYIEDGLIAQVSNRAFPVSDRTRRIDGRGLFLTPGLMDSHAHVTFVPGIGIDGSDRTKHHPKLAKVYRQQQPRSLLYYGVTQVVDPSPAPSWKTFTDAQIHPDLFRCGVLPNLGGYPQMAIDDAIKTFPHFVLADPSNPPLDIDPAQHSPEASVNAIADSGAICVKIYIENGFGADASLPIPSNALITRIKLAADKRGLLLYAHANALDMAQIALRTDVDIIGHGLWNWNWAENNGPPPVQDILDQINAKNVGYIPTFGVIEGLQHLMAPDSLDNPLLSEVTPRALLDWYSTREAQWFKEELLADFGPDATTSTVFSTFGHTINRARQSASYLNDIGHPIVLGSDYPGSPSYIKQPGLSTYQEILALSAAGLSPQAIFEAATLNNARLYKLDNQYGSVEVGKIANLLLLSSNPLEDITAWNTIDTVILHGATIQRDSLKAQ